MLPDIVVATPWVTVPPLVGLVMEMLGPLGGLSWMTAVASLVLVLFW